jgi:hypothetical protein
VPRHGGFQSDWPRHYLNPRWNSATKIVELRECLPRLEARGDPVDYLDHIRPTWRNELPFDIECEDIRSMVEQIVRVRNDGAAALDVGRILVRLTDNWHSRACQGSVLVLQPVAVVLSKSGLQRCQLALDIFSPVVRPGHQEYAISGIFKQLCYGVRSDSKNKEYRGPVACRS